MTQEFDARQDRWIDIAAALDRHAAVLVRRGLEPGLLAAVLREAQAEFARRDLQHTAGTLPRDQRDLHVQHRAILVRDLVVNGVPAPQMLMPPLVLAAATLLLGKLPQVNFSSFRCVRVDAADLALPYHQDGRIVNRLAPQLGPNPPLINMWVPLQDCGIDRPGLEVVNRTTAALLPVIEHGKGLYAAMGVEIAAETVDRIAGPAERWHPSCAAGDFLLFKGTTIHRTHVTAAMTGERISADLRLL